MFISNAYAQAAAEQPQGGGLFLPLMMVGILLFMYFTTIRPQRKRQKEHGAMVTALQKGDEVALSSGMMGKISAVDDNYLVLSVGKERRAEVSEGSCDLGVAQGHAEVCWRSV